MHIAIALFASSWGVKLTGDAAADQPEAVPIPAGAPTIADIAEAAAVARGGDTTVASEAVLARLARLRETS